MYEIEAPTLLRYKRYKEKYNQATSLEEFCAFPGRIINGTGLLSQMPVFPERIISGRSSPAHI